MVIELTAWHVSDMMAPTDRMQSNMLLLYSECNIAVFGNMLIANIDIAVTIKKQVVQP